MSKPPANLGFLFALADQYDKLGGRAGKQMADLARKQGGKLAMMVGTGDAVAKAKVGDKVRATGIKVPDVSAESDAPLEEEKPKRPRKRTSEKLSGTLSLKA